MGIDRLISEMTGKMMKMKKPCIQLEDVYCRAECTPKRIGCPSASYLMVLLVFFLADT